MVYLGRFFDAIVSLKSYYLRKRFLKTVYETSGAVPRAQSTVMNKAWSQPWRGAQGPGRGQGASKCTANGR